MICWWMHNIQKISCRNESQSSLLPVLLVQMEHANMNSSEEIARESAVPCLLRKPNPCVMRAASETLPKLYRRLCVSDRETACEAWRDMRSEVPQICHSVSSSVHPLNWIRISGLCRLQSNVLDRNRNPKNFGTAFWLKWAEAEIFRLSLNFLKFEFP